MTREELLQKYREPTKVLDHGFIRLDDVMGGDAAVCQAARVSHADAKQRSEDRTLIRYLMRHRHSSPLEMAEIKIHWKLPIFVARQVIRHRTCSVNEVSGRYSVLPNEMYVPAAEVILPQSTTNKQGRSAVTAVDTAYAQRYLQIVEPAQASARTDYETLVNEGYAKEIARINLPVAQYTEWYWKVDLRNLLHFCSLRLDQHAQYEVRVYAEAIAKIVADWVPLIWEAFEDYDLYAMQLSRQEVAAIRHEVALLCGAKGVEWPERPVLAGREAAECQAKLEQLGLASTPGQP
jgi:thymidylate synthase (FAD)